MTQSEMMQKIQDEIQRDLFEALFGQVEIIKSKLNYAVVSYESGEITFEHFVEVAAVAVKRTDAVHSLTGMLKIATLSPGYSLDLRDWHTWKDRCLEVIEDAEQIGDEL